METPESESDELNEDFQIFRESIRAAAERPETFWASQRAGIASKMLKPVSFSGLRPELLWAPTLIVVVLCLFLFVEKSKAPTPDYAAGADQILLVEVEQALRRDCPEALAPAAHITRQIDRVSVSAKRLPVKK
jgi:hypothetical protein